MAGRLSAETMHGPEPTKPVRATRIFAIANAPVDGNDPTVSALKADIRALARQGRARGVTSSCGLGRRRRNSGPKATGKPAA